MAANLPDVNCRYGAPMGRRDNRGDPDAVLKFHLCRVYLDSGGYDRGGAYWGIGGRLYQAEADGADGELVSMYLRASGRDGAKEHIRQEYPNARFYR